MEDETVKGYLAFIDNTLDQAEGVLSSDEYLELLGKLADKVQDRIDAENNFF